ncbi:MAG: hypothetical protein GY906_21975 [bacterium]|nr:hypothetical protein [bacterium]
MAARVLYLIARADLIQAFRGVVASGRFRILSAVVGGIALVAAELWIADNIADHVLSLPEPFSATAQFGLTHLIVLILELATVIAAASALTVALSIIERSETDPWWAACPIPPAYRALQCWWRVVASLTWVMALALPPACALSPQCRDNIVAVLRFGLGGVLLLFFAAALGCTLAIGLAALVPRRVLTPLSWTATTAAIVSAVVWLRRLHPEELATIEDPAHLARWLTETGALMEHTGPLARIVVSAGGGESLHTVIAAAGGSLVALLLVFQVCAPRARRNLSTEAHQTPRLASLWRVVDILLTRGSLGTLIASRLRLVVRDASQGAQVLYILGLGAVYVENLRALPLSEPLAVELAGLINLAMSSLLVVALGLRFAYPARLLEGVSHWWWSTAPVSRLGADAAMAAVAALPSLVLSCALFGASILVTGPSHATQYGWWIIPWLSVWISALGLAIGPSLASPHHTSWLDAALGGGGLSYLAFGLGGAGLCVVAAGRQVIATLAHELGHEWDPGFLFGQPTLIAALLSLVVAGAYIYRTSQPDE